MRPLAAIPTSESAAVNPRAIEIPLARSRVVLTGLGCSAECSLAAGDNALNHLVRNAVRSADIPKHRARRAVRWCRRRCRRAARPSRNRSTMPSTACAICGIAAATASATLRSSSLMTRRTSAVGRVSIFAESGLRCSVRRFSSMDTRKPGAARRPASRATSFRSIQSQR